jgi:hypothetical protein
MLAQGREPIPEKPKYEIRVDSQFIKGTPYEILTRGDDEYHLDKDVEYYTDATIYEYTPIAYNEQGSLIEESTLLPTIFLLSGGGFVNLDNQPDLDPGNSTLHPDLALAKKLANDGYKVIWINYQVETNIAFAFLISQLFVNPTGGSCLLTLKNEEAKARIEHASLKSFRDFRVKFRNFINNNVANNIDPNNVFVAGISAGAVLTIYSVFLDQSEIPFQIPFANCNNGVFNINIAADAPLRTDGYPIPPIKGIIPMAGGSFYNNIFDNNLSYTNNVSINLMHGTCDELINQDKGRVIYKFLGDPNNLVYNQEPANLYPTVYGSKHVYNILSNTHSKVGFGQVINGGHSVITNFSNVNPLVGGWDAYVPAPQPSNPPNMNNPLNSRNPVYDNFTTFLGSVLQKPGFPAWVNNTYSIFPDLPSGLCLQDDLSLLSPPIVMPEFVCATNVTASLGQSLPPGGTIVWSVTSNLTIIGSNTGTTLTFTRTSNMSGTGTVTAAVTYNGVTVVVSKTIAIYPTLVIGMYSANPFVVNGVPQAPLPNKLPIPIGVPTTISFTIPNAAQAGITEMLWLSRCGTITNGPIHTWNGNDLTSTITVIISSESSCTNMNVRPVNPCGIGQWKSQACEKVSGMSSRLANEPFEDESKSNSTIELNWLRIVPNPAMFNISAIVETNVDVPEEGWRYVIVNQIGSMVKEGRIFSKNEQVSIDNMPNGMYNFILFGQDVANSSFIIMR